MGGAVYPFLYPPTALPLRSAPLAGPVILFILLLGLTVSASPSAMRHHDVRADAVFSER